MLKFLLILFSIIYLGSLLGKWFLRKWMRNLSNQQNTYEKQKKEGEVTINYDKKANSGRNNNEGEYIDYEEVK